MSLASGRGGGVDEQSWATWGLGELGSRGACCTKGFARALTSRGAGERATLFFFGGPRCSLPTRPCATVRDPRPLPLLANKTAKCRLPRAGSSLHLAVLLARRGRRWCLDWHETSRLPFAGEPAGAARLVVAKPRDGQEQPHARARHVGGTWPSRHRPSMDPQLARSVAGEDRTHDLRIMRPTRYQLRYCHSGDDAQRRVARLCSRQRARGHSSLHT